MGDIQRMLNKPYKWGFTSDVESETIPRGLSEATVRLISAKKREPDWMLDFRLRAYRTWLAMAPPEWSDNAFPAIDYQSFFYYSEPKQREVKQSLDEVDPALLATFEKLGIPLGEQKRLANVAVDAVFDSVSIATTFRKELAAAGVVFCSFSEAVREYPDLVRRYMGSVVPVADKCVRTERESATGGVGSGWAVRAFGAGPTDLCAPPFAATSPRSTRPCSLTARSCTCPRAYAARWSCPRTSASTARAHSRRRGGGRARRACGDHPRLTHATHAHTPPTPLVPSPLHPPPLLQPRRRASLSARSSWLRTTGT